MLDCCVDGDSAAAFGTCTAVLPVALSNETGGVFGKNVFGMFDHAGVVRQLASKDVGIVLHHVARVVGPDLIEEDAVATANDHAPAVARIPCEADAGPDVVVVVGIGRPIAAAQVALDEPRPELDRRHVGR